MSLQLHFVILQASQSVFLGCHAHLLFEQPGKVIHIRYPQRNIISEGQVRKDDHKLTRSGKRHILAITSFSHRGIRQVNNANELATMYIEICNVPYFCRNIYTRYIYRKIDKWKETHGDQYTFLHEQLSWIGKEYDPECWLGIRENREEFKQYLKTVCKDCETKGMDKQEQNAFSKRCQAYFDSLAVTPENYRKDKSRYKKTTMKMNKLNKIFEELKIPFKISSYRDSYQVTRWEVVAWVSNQTEEELAQWE